MRLTRRLRHLNEALEALDQRLQSAKGDQLLAYSRLTPSELAFVREEISSCLTSRTYYLENYHIIQTERGELTGMYPLWDQQWIIENAIAAERERTFKLDGVSHSQHIVLKPRQTGGTEFANGVMCWCAFFTPQGYTLTVAQDLDRASWIQRKVNTAWFHLPWWLQPERQYHTKGEHLEFQRKDESQRQVNPGLGSVFVTTHAEKGAGVAIGKTIRFFHGTEVSRWGSGEIYTADIEPSMNAEDKLAIMESAPLGDNGFFVNLWNEATDDPDSEWVPVFLPVYRARKYSLPRWPAKLKHPISPPLTETELAQRARVLAEEKFKISDEFFNWRRLRVKLATKRDGNPYQHYAAYPMTPKEAFQSSISAVFPRDKLDFQERNISRVILAGEVVYQGPNMPLKRAFLQDVPVGQILPKRGPVGTHRLHVWEEPLPGAIYYLSADTALGREDGDFSACTVWKVGRGSQQDVQVAEWHGKIPPLDWAKVLYALGFWYWKAEIAVEYQGDGRSTGDALKETLDYPNLYRPRKHDRVDGVAMFNYFHFQTNTHTKPKMVVTMVEALLEGSVKINSQLLIDEMRKFGVTSMPSATYTAYGGLAGHDDAAMAALIGLLCLREVMPEFRDRTGDPSGNSPSRSARSVQGGCVYAVHDEWTRMRTQTRDLAAAEDLCRVNSGWMIKPIQVSRANTAYSVIHHARGAEHSMYREGVDSKEILPAAIFAWKGARAAEAKEVDEIQAWAEGGEQGGWSEME